MATKRKLQLGDLIEIFREGYQHWAVYIGNNYIVHLTNNGGGSSSSFSGTTEAEVKRQKLEKVCENDKWRINNYLDNDYEPRSANAIVREALARVGTFIAYNLFSRNCEHFATELRYGIAHSQQVASGPPDRVQVGAATGISLVRGFGFLPVVALGASLMKGRFSSSS